MAGRFGIFSDSASNNTFGSLNRAREKAFAPAPPKLSLENQSIGSKALLPAQPKPKGLSIRSKSELNISVANASSSAALSKSASKDYLKPQDKPAGLKKNSLSPFKIKTPKSKSIANITPKKLSPKTFSSPSSSSLSPYKQSFADHLFKKPATPLRFRIRQAENLACDCDQHELANEQMRMILAGDLAMLRQARTHDDVWPYEFENSYDDEEQLPEPEPNMFIDESYSLSISPSLGDVRLPSLSDCED